MTIDVLSELGSAPIIVGDEIDMSDLRSIVCDDAGRYFIHMAGDNLAPHDVGLTPPACENFRTARHLLLVNVAGDTISRARRVCIDNFEDGHELSAEQCRALAEALSLDDGRDFRTAKLDAFRRSYPDLAAA